MRSLCILMLATIALPDRPNPTPMEVVKPFHEQLVGEWRLVSVVVGGDVRKEKVGAVVTFTKNELHVFEKGERQNHDDATYVIDDKKSPTHIDLSQNVESSRKVEGIIKIDGNRLMFCFPFGGMGARPTTFEATPGTQQALMTFERIK